MLNTGMRLCRLKNNFRLYSLLLHVDYSSSACVHCDKIISTVMIIKMKNKINCYNITNKIAVNINTCAQYRWNWTDGIDELHVELEQLWQHLLCSHFWQTGSHVPDISGTNKNNTFLYACFVWFRVSERQSRRRSYLLRAPSAQYRHGTAGGADVALLSHTCFSQVSFPSKSN